MEGSDIQPTSQPAQPRQIISGYQPDVAPAAAIPAAAVENSDQAIPIKVNVQSTASPTAPFAPTSPPIPAPLPNPNPSVSLTPSLQQPIAPAAPSFMDIQPANPMPGSLQSELPQPDLQAKIDNHPLFSGASAPPPKKPHRGLRRLAWASGVIIVLLAIAYTLIDAGIVRGASHLPFHIFKQSTATTVPVIATPTTATTDPYVGWKTYTNSKYGISYKYPTTWMESGDAVMPGTDALGSEFSTGLKLTIDKKYNNTVVVQVLNKSLTDTTAYYDKYYVQSATSKVTKTGITTKGKTGVQYDVINSGVESKLYLFSVSSKTYSFSSVNEELNVQTAADYWASFAKVFDSLQITST